MSKHRPDWEGLGISNVQGSLAGGIGTPPGSTVEDAIVEPSEADYVLAPIATDVDYAVQQLRSVLDRHMNSAGRDQRAMDALARVQERLKGGA